MSNPDILVQLETVWSCSRCKCRSCESGYENHSHRCTEGPDCLETREKMRARRHAESIVAWRASDEIKSLRARVAALTVENGLGEGI